MRVKSDYYTRSKSRASPGRHGSIGHPQPLDFLYDFDNGNCYQEVASHEPPHVVQNPDEYRSDDDLDQIDDDDGSMGEGRFYTAFLAVIWLIVSLVTSSPLFTAILLSIAAAFFTNSSVLHMAGDANTSFKNTTSLERRQSRTDTSIPTAVDPLPRNAHSILSSKLWFSTPKQRTRQRDPYRGQHPDWQPRRLWSEALRTAKPHFIAIGKRICKVAVQFVYFQLQLQLLITIAQTLGIHFSAGSDEHGLFPRYWHNLTSLDNLFGVVGKETLARHTNFIVGWWWDWFFGVTSLFLWRMPKALARVAWNVMAQVVMLPLEVIARGTREEELVKEFNYTVTEVRKVEPWVARLWRGAEETVTVTKTR